METNYIEINYNGQKTRILKYLSESNTQFDKRIEFIKKLEKQQVNYKEAIRLSKIWYCIKYRQCKYLPNIYQTIMFYDKI